MLATLGLGLGLGPLAPVVQRSRLSRSFAAILHRVFALWMIADGRGNLEARVLSAHAQLHMSRKDIDPQNAEGLA